MTHAPPGPPSVKQQRADDGERCEEGQRWHHATPLGSECSSHRWPMYSIAPASSVKN